MFFSKKFKYTIIITIIGVMNMEDENQTQNMEAGNEKRIRRNRIDRDIDAMFAEIDSLVYGDDF